MEYGKKTPNHPRTRNSPLAALVGVALPLGRMSVILARSHFGSGPAFTSGHL